MIASYAATKTGAVLKVLDLFRQRAEMERGLG